MKYSVLLFLAFIFFSSGVARAQFIDSVQVQDVDEEGPDTKLILHTTVNPEEVSKRKGYTSEPIELKKFDHKKWKEIVGDRQYTSPESSQKPREKDKKMDKNSSSEPNQRVTPNERVREEEPDDTEDQREDYSTSHRGSSGSLFVSLIVYTLAIGIIVYILFLILKNISFRSTKKLAKPVTDDTTHVEDIHELEIDSLLNNALQAGNHRLAIRIYYLGLLQTLDEQGFIHWKKDKTNRDYLTELFSKNRYYDEVRKLTMAYEEVWYGDHQLSASAYEKIIALFHTLQRDVKTPTAG